VLGRLWAHLIAALAEIEREMIREMRSGWHRPRGRTRSAAGSSHWTWRAFRAKQVEQAASEASVAQTTMKQTEFAIAPLLCRASTLLEWRHH
jgi:hypothetical protein